MALGAIPFTISETGNVGRTGALLASTLSSMRFPIAVPLRFDENKLNASAFRVIDTTTGLAVPAAFRIADEPYSHSRQVGGARWGDFGNTSHRIKLVHVDMLPTLNPGETRTYQLQTSGGTGSTPGSMVTTQAGYYEINTGVGGITCRVPRTGPMSLIRYLKENTTNREIINGDGGGIWIRGVANAPVPGPNGYGAGPANNQADDYFSRNDASGDGTDNGGYTLEGARPTKYFTSVLFANSQVACIKIDTIRCRNAAGTDFRGMNRFYSTAGVPTTRPVTWDVYLYFYRNSAAIRRVVLCQSTGGGEGFDSATPSSAMFDGYGVDVVTTFTGSMQAAMRDETAATKVARVTSATAKTIRQMHTTTGVAPNTYGMSLARTGDMPASTSITQLEAFYSVSDGQKGLIRAPWEWRARAPMGWAHTPVSGTLRWELAHPDIAAQDPRMNTMTVGAHGLMGPHWFYAEEWLIAYSGALTDAQITATVRALAGRHEQKHAGVWADTPSELAHGAQQPSLVGYANADHWDDTRIWRRLPPVSPAIRSDLLGGPGFVGLPAKFVPGGSKFDDVPTMLNRWADSNHDDAVTTLALPTPGSFRGIQARTVNRQHWTWLFHGCGGASGGGFGANEYEQNQTPLLSYLRRGDRGDFAVGWEGTTHQIMIDQQKFFPTLGQFAGENSDVVFVSDFLHIGTGPGAMEYQQNFEAPAMLWLLTAEPWIMDGLLWHGFYLDRWTYGGQGASSGPSTVAHWQPDTATISGGVLTVAHPERWPLPTHGLGLYVRLRAVTNPAAAGNSVAGVRSIGNMIIAPIPWCDVIGGGPDEGNGTFPATGFAIRQGWWVGSVITVNGVDYRVVRLRESFYDQMNTYTGNGATATFAYTYKIFFTSDLRVVVAGAVKVLGTHYTVSGAGSPTGGTITFLAGSIPLAGQAIQIRGFCNRRVEVTPTPSPAFDGTQTAVVSFWPNLSYSAARVHLKGFNGNAAIVATALPAAGPYTMVGDFLTYSFVRSYGWDLAAAVGMARIFGRTMPLNVPVSATSMIFPLYQYIHDALRFLLMWEQFITHPQGIAQMGGVGTWGLLAGDDTNIATIVGSAKATHSTYHAYPVIPCLTATEFGHQYRTQGIAADVFEATFHADGVGMLERWGKHTAMGVDGLSPIISGGAEVGGGGDPTGANALKRFPIGRGSHLQSAGAYQVWTQPYVWAFGEEPTRAGTVKEDFLYSGKNFNALTTGALFENLTGAGFVTACFAPDVLAYVAEQKYHAAGDFTRRDLWARMAREIWAQVLCVAFEQPFGTYVNPETYVTPTAGLNLTGKSHFRMSVYQPWRLKHGGYVGRMSFGAVIPDTTPPTETALLTEVSKTSTQITVDGPAATDNVGVAGYRFFKGGVQDGPDQLGTSHTYTGLSAGLTYTLKRRAFDAAGLTADSNTLSITTPVSGDTTPPTVPTNLDGTTTTTTATLTFAGSTDLESGIKQYRVYRNGVEVGTVPP